MSEEQNKPKRTYFRPTTPQQRRLLFETYEQTHDLEAACRVAHMGRRTFFYWLARFREGGYAALDHERSRAPHKTRIPPTPQAIVEEVCAYRRAQPQAGYQRIADELQKAHDWQRVISASQVRRILVRAGLVATTPPKPAPETPVVVHAPTPETTVNIDLCLVPVSHAAGVALGAVNSSATGAFPPSGRASAVESAAA